MNEELDEFVFLYESFFDEISNDSQREIKARLTELVEDFQEIIKKETL